MENIFVERGNQDDQGVTYAGNASDFDGSSKESGTIHVDCKDRALIQDLWLIIRQMGLVAEMLNVAWNYSAVSDLAGHDDQKIVLRLTGSIAGIWTLLQQEPLEDHQGKWLEQIVDAVHQALWEHAYRMEGMGQKPFPFLMCYHMRSKLLDRIDSERYLVSGGLV